MFAPLSSQVQALTDALRAFVLRVRPYKKAPQLLLSVEGGMHDQCNKTVRLDAISIGADDECDFILLDPAISRQHVSIAVSHSIIGPLATVSATEAPIEVNGQTVKPDETSRHLQLPLKLTVADGVSVSLDKRKRAVRQVGAMELFLSRLLRIMAVMAAAAFGVLVWDTFFSTKFAVSLNDATHRVPKEHAVPAVDLPMFKSKLTEMGLDGALNVKETEDGTLMVSGRLSPVQSRKWAEFSQWYDSVSYSKPMVVQFERTGELPGIPPIAIVRLSEPKEIILKNGETMSVDNVFSGDWKVAAIKSDHIVIARDGYTEKLMYARPADE